MSVTLPRGSGVSIFAGGGAWRPRPTQLAVPSDEAIILSEPLRTLVATEPEELYAVLEEVEAEQQEGRYVAGYLTYEAGAAFGLAVRTPSADAIPLAWMAVYEPEKAIVLPAAQWKELLANFDVTPVADALADTTPRLSVSKPEYVDAIARVRDYIAAGDTYQVNYTVRGRFELRESIGPLDYFLALVVRQAVPYAAYFDLGDAQVVSLSPELFLRRDGRRLESRPMKGTRPRGSSHALDVALAHELALTEKERAENLMIVDMVRNDLGRVCRAGSVRVPNLYAVEPYRTVWQMVSTVTGDVNPRASLADVVQAVFPGASITGAPKHHTMEIIAELETEPRGVYTGAVGLFSPGGDFTCNIAIRTITHRQGHCTLGTGSGVVWDAEPVAEYEETLVKAAFATPPRPDTSSQGGKWRPEPADRAAATAASQDGFYLFETVLLEAHAGLLPAEEDQAHPDGDGAGSRAEALLSLSDAAVLARYRSLEEHLARMAASAQALGLPFERQDALQLMLGLARVTPEAIVARLQLEPRGCFTLSTREAPREAGADPVTLLVSPFRTDPDDLFLRHKTSFRGFYDREHRRALSESCFDALFVNRVDRVTEGAITNVFARFGDDWVTPPLDDGLLPGIWRAGFLRETGAAESSLSMPELLAADEVVVGNSVRGTARVADLVLNPVTY